MVIGIPREIMHDEMRVSATPATVRKMTAEGNAVLVEKNAGTGAYFTDNEYSGAGAEMVCDVSELFGKSDLILKVKEPQFNEQKGIHETDMMRRGQYLIAFIHPASPSNHGTVRKMAEKGVICLTLDGMPRITRAQNMDALTSMSTCAGYRGFIMAAERLGRFIPGIFHAAGAIKPANVLVVGAGVAGLQAIATAKRLGASVYASDVRSAAREQAQSLGAKITDIGVPEEEATGEGGYAKQLSEKWLSIEREKTGEAVKNMDIVFLSALVPGRLAPVIVTEEMVKSMRAGSVIVDISIDQGGNCGITLPGKTAVLHGVEIIGIKNIPGHLPVSSTVMFAENVYNLIRYLSENGKLRIDKNDEIVSPMMVTDGEKVVHKGALEAMASY